MLHAGDLLSVLILALGSARITRIVVKDTVAQPLRTAVIRRFSTGWQTQLIHCPWCVGWWISAIMVVTAGLAGLLSGFWVTLFAIPAVAQGAAWIRELSDKE